MSVAKFEGETNWDAIVSHGALDIVREDSFRQYLISNGYNPDDTDLPTLEKYFNEWSNGKPPTTPQSFNKEMPSGNFGLDTLRHG